MLIGNFNMSIENKNFEVFMKSFGLDCLIKKSTFLQSKNPSCIDQILTNKKYLSKNFTPQFHHYHLEKLASQRKLKNKITLRLQ